MLLAGYSADVSFGCDNSDFSARVTASSGAVSCDTKTASCGGVEETFIREHCSGNDNTHT